MPNFDPSTLAALTFIRNGARVDRPAELASLHIITGADTALFNILGGKIALLAIWGEVTVQLDAVASLILLVGNPTVGTSVNLCAASAAITSATVGQCFTMTGTLATPMVISDAGGFLLQNNALVLDPGTIDLNSTITQTVVGGGMVKWTAFYLPLEDGASMTSTI